MITITKALRLIPVWQVGTFATVENNRLVMCTPGGLVHANGTTSDLVDTFPITNGQVSARSIRLALGY